MSKTNNLFESFLMEDNSNPTIPSSGNSSEGLNPYEESFIVNGMNAALVGITDSPTINPYYIVERIKERVKSMFGLTFEDVNFSNANFEEADFTSAKISNSRFDEANMVKAIMKEVEMDNVNLQKAKGNHL